MRAEKWAQNDDLPRFARLLNPLIDLVARIPASVQVKLLAGFLGSTAVLLLVGLISAAVIAGLNSRVAMYGTAGQVRLEIGLAMEHEVTLQTDYRALTLLTGDRSYDDRFAQVKQLFAGNIVTLDQTLAISPAEVDPAFPPDLAQIRDANERFTQADAHVVALDLAGQKDAALQAYLQEERPIADEMAAAARSIWVRSAAYLALKPFGIEADRAPLTTPLRVTPVLGAFALAVGISVAVAVAVSVVLGFFLSWAFIRPVRRINRALASITGGDFSQRVSVPNRDEFGSLSDHVNTMSAELERLYGQVRSVSENLQAVVDNAMDGIVTLDAQGIIRTFNPVAQVIFGYTSNEAIGRPIDRLVPELAGARGVTDGRREVEGRKKDGATFPIEVAASGMQVRDERGFIVILRDITERKRAQTELGLARDLALEASRAKSTFVANMSHELRTPLNAILGYSEMLQEQATDLDQLEYIPDLQKIHAAGRHLLELINAVLDLSRIEAGKMDLYLESFAVEPIVRDVAALIRPLALKNANQLQVSCAPDAGSMYADLTKVRQVLFNLLSNACKFTEQGSVSLQVERTTEAGVEWLIFRVSDTGIGLTSEQMSKLFQPFTQADASTMRKYGGTGLGLALCHRFCQMMGGDISLASELGHGSTLTVRLPARVAEPAAAPAPDAGPAAESLLEESPLDAPTILVIDDDPAARDLLVRGLGRERFRVCTATGAEEGVRIARELRPDAITLDVFMPGADGWSALSALKADPATADIPVIMITMSENKRLSYVLGATEYFTKPVDRERLVSVLRSILDKANSPTVLVVDNDPKARQVLARAIEPDHWTEDTLHLRPDS